MTSMIPFGIFAYRKFVFPIKKIIVSRRKNIKCDVGAYFDRKSILMGSNYLGNDVFLSQVELGYGSYIADFSKIFKTKIGKFSSIGQNVSTAIGNHPISENISTSPSFFSMNPSNNLKYVSGQYFNELPYEDELGYCIWIGNDVWIGSNVTILGGVHIGDGAIVGAGSVVTKDIEPYSVNYGNPCKKIRYRFDNVAIDKLEKMEWWNKSERWLKENADKFHDLTWLEMEEKTF